METYYLLKDMTASRWEGRIVQTGGRCRRRLDQLGVGVTQVQQALVDFAHGSVIDQPESSS